MLARTERVHVAKSALIKTSVKKLFPLARQIAGKPLEEAMVQMRFSRRKAAAEVLEHLRWARDGGVVGRGMGLGGVDALEVGGEGQEGVRKGAEGESGEGKKKGAKRIVVEDKKGKRIVVTDRSAMYVDEAWVGRGPYENGSDHRARGKINRLRLPYTSEFVSSSSRSLLLPAPGDGEEIADGMLIQAMSRYFYCVEGRSVAHTVGAGAGAEEKE